MHRLIDQLYARFVSMRAGKSCITGDQRSIQDLGQASAKPAAHPALSVLMGRLLDMLIRTGSAAADQPEAVG
jgi:hypothetical protein